MKHILFFTFLAFSLTACDNLKSDEELCKKFGEQQTSIERWDWYKKAWNAEKAGTPWAGITIPQNYRTAFEQAELHGL